MQSEQVSFNELRTERIQALARGIVLRIQLQSGNPFRLRLIELAIAQQKASGVRLILCLIPCGFACGQDRAMRVAQKVLQQQLQELGLGRC